MSFLSNFAHHADPITDFTMHHDPLSKAIFDKKAPPPPPGVPNPNDAQNAAQSQKDAMRQRRGVLANIYAGQTSQSAPVTGTTTLGT